MSTRCQIGIYDTKPDPATTPDALDDYEALIYRHSDGYPGTAGGSEIGVLPDILPFLKSFIARRGFDPEYLAARLLAHLCRQSDANMQEYEKLRPRSWNSPDDVDPEFGGVLGFGISKGFHGDIEYVYAVHPGGVEVFDVEAFDGHGAPKVRLRTSILFERPAAGPRGIQ